MYFDDHSRTYGKGIPLPALMWFRSDLRMLDNTALDQACRDATDGVIAVFAVCARQWQEHDWGAPKVDFVLRNVSALSDALAKRNIPLLILNTPRFATLPRKLEQLADRHHCSALYFNREYEVNEQRRDREVTALFERRGRTVRTFCDQVILDVSEIRTGSGGWYSVFTPFKRAWTAKFQSDGPMPLHSNPKTQPARSIKGGSVPQDLSAFAGTSLSDRWPAGEAAAKRRLRAFVADRIENYHRDRDAPALAGTSELSPYLAAGVLSPRQCLAAALEANDGRLDGGRRGMTTWISELIWREFYRHVLIGVPRVCMHRPFRLETDRVPWRDDADHLEAWRQGRTGVPIVDAGMRQLAQTGWMHNRVRMITAMFLTKQLLIDWRLGERHFLNHLIDADFASNNGGWQWSASTGTDAAPYFRIFNPFTQAKRFDPKAQYIHEYVPELRPLSATAIHDPNRPTDDEMDYPPPIVDHKSARQRAIEAFKNLGDE